MTADRANRDALLAEVASAYEGLEDPAAFPDADALERYRAGLLERTAEQADFIAGRLDGPARVVEAACGNGRLLIELARRGALGEGVGFDIARSRIAFARRWASDLGLGSIAFSDEDALRVELAPGR